MFGFLQSFAHWPYLLFHFYSSTSAEKQQGRKSLINSRKRILLHLDQQEAQKQKVNLNGWEFGLETGFDMQLLASLTRHECQLCL